jgi:hypothetical protein
MKKHSFHLSSTVYTAVALSIQAFAFLFHPASSLAADQCSKMQIASNLGGMSYYAPTIPFKDLVAMRAGTAVLPKTTGATCTYQLDGDSWPKVLPSTCYYRVWLPLHVRNAYTQDIPPYRAGKYVLLYSGKGDISFGWDAKNAVKIKEGRYQFDVPKPYDGIEVRVTTSDPVNYVRDMHVVRVEDEASYLTHPWNDDYVTMLRNLNLKALRFMDLSGASLSFTIYSGKGTVTNSTTLVLASAPTQTVKAGQVLMTEGHWERIFVKSYNSSTRTVTLETPLTVSGTPANPGITIFDFPNRHWADRTPLTITKQTTAAGIAIEYQIALANELHVDPYFNLPVAADDDFIKREVQLIKSKLDPGLTPYFEWGNETWNYGYPGYHYSEAMIRRLAMGTQPVWIPADAYQAYRFIEIVKILSSVYNVSKFAAQRTSKPFYAVLTSQTGWPDRATKVMEWGSARSALPSQSHAASEYADAFAVTYYFGRPKVGANPKGIKDMSVTELLAEQNAHIDELVNPSSPDGVVYQVVQRAIQHGMKAIMYEGGTTLLPADQNDTTQIDKLTAMNLDPRMKDVYLHAFRNWQGLVDKFGIDHVGMFNQFTDVGGYSKYGFWGALMSTYQNPATAPKYLAIQEWNRQCVLPPAPKNLRLH